VQWCSWTQKLDAEKPSFGQRRTQRVASGNILLAGKTQQQLRAIISMLSAMSPAWAG
jgi:hypothetical protein